MNPHGTLFFYSGSRDAPAPGCGANETCATDDATKGLHAELFANHKGWRKYLSNFYRTPNITISVADLKLASEHHGTQLAMNQWTRHLEDDHFWVFNCVEAAFQGLKFIFSSAFSTRFEVDGVIGSACKAEPPSVAGLQARKARKVFMLSKDQLKVWDAVSSSVMLAALRARSKVDAKFCEILRLTVKATLLHAAARQRPQRQYNLEKVRDEN